MYDDGGEADNVLAQDAKLVLASGTSCDPCDIHIGMELWSNHVDKPPNTVIGIFETDALDTREEAPLIVSYKGIPMSARQVLYHNERWRKVCCIASPMKHIDRSSYKNNYYHILTTHGMFWITSNTTDERVLIRDFREVLREV